MIASFCVNSSDGKKRCYCAQAEGYHDQIITRHVLDSTIGCGRGCSSLYGTGWVAGQTITILQTCFATSLKVPISECLCYGATIYGILTPRYVVFKCLAVDIAGVQEVAIGWGAGENRLYLTVELCFVAFCRSYLFIRATCI